MDLEVTQLLLYLEEKGVLVTWAGGCYTPDEWRKRTTFGMEIVPRYTKT